MKRADLEQLTESNPILVGHLLAVEDDILDKMAVYTADDESNPARAQCAEIAKSLDISPNPVLVVIDDSAWERYWELPISMDEGSSAAADATSNLDTKTITLKKSVFDNYVEGQAKATWIMSHEHGHLTDKNDQFLNRRELLAAGVTGAIGLGVFGTQISSMLSKEMASDAEIKKAEEGGKADKSKDYPAFAKLADAALLMAAPAVIISGFGAATLASMRKEEFMADEQAAKVTPAHVLAQAVIEHLDEQFDVAPNEKVFGITKSDYQRAMTEFDDNVHNHPDASSEQLVAAKAIYISNVITSKQTDVLRFIKNPTQAQRLQNLERRGHLDTGDIDISP